MSIQEVEAAKVGVRETGGSNRSEFIDHINQEVGVPLGSSWCASFQSWGYRAANGGDHAWWQSAGSQAIKRAFDEKGLLFRDPQHLLKCTGALFGWTDSGDSAHGHIGLIVGRQTDAEGKVVAIKTIEGNSNAGGSSNGDGVYEHTREVPISNGHHLYFMDLTGQPGCDYWS